MKASEVIALIKILTPHKKALSEYYNHSMFSILDDRVLAFINDFSSSLLDKKEYRKFPDLIALGYWLRKSNLRKIEKEINSSESSYIKTPIGNVLHFAPSNVDTIFIYSLFLSLLMGNKNIVRVSSKASAQKDIIIKLISDLLRKSKHKSMLKVIMIVTFDHNDGVLKYLSNNADLRIIWGGDETVTKISSIPLKPISSEIRFADKYSFSLINAEKFKVINDKEKAKLANNFANDSYWFSQQGCSSPRTVFWINHLNNDQEIEDFWNRVSEVASKNFKDEIQPADVMNKVVSEDLTAISTDCRLKITSPLLHRVQNIALSDQKKLRGLHCGSGLFIESKLENISELAQVLDRKVQTISYYGFTINDVRENFEIEEIFPDRVVPIGKALDFSHIWDGYNLLDSLIRRVDFK